MKRILYAVLMLFTLSLSAQKFKSSFLQGDGVKGFYTTLWDYDQDGDNDLVVGTSSRIDLYVNKWNGDFEKSSNNPFSTIYIKDNRGACPVFADLDQDGDLDLFIAYTKRVAGGNYYDLETKFKCYMNKDGVFEENTALVYLLNLGVWTGVITPTATDWENDGTDDLLITMPGGTVYILDIINGLFY